MNEILKITSVMKVDVCLWTETKSNTRYFENMVLKASVNVEERKKI